MAINIKKKRVSRQYQIFFFACLASLLGLLVYILGAKLIPFPHQGMAGIDGTDKETMVAAATKLFFAGVSVHLSVNFVLGLFFSLLNPDKMDQVKLKKWRFGISRTLIFIGSLITGLMIYGQNVKGNTGNILLLCLIITVINCCLLELLIQLMNQYGICNAFNLILLTEFLPYNGIAENGKRPEPMLYLLLFTVFFIGITNLKGEAPVETNTLYSQKGKVLKKNKTKLGFRLSLSFFPLIQLSQFVSWIYNLVLMRKAGVSGGSVDSIHDGGKSANNTRALNTNNGLKTSLSNKDNMAGGSFFGPFFLLSDGKRIFDFENLKDGFGDIKWGIVSALFFLLFLRGLAVGLQMRKTGYGKTGEMSKDLRGRGIYINRLAPGHSTRNLLRKVINKIIFFGFFIILILNIIFDNMFKSFEPYLPFFSGFGSVNIGVDLVRQIRTKYKYIKTNK